MKSLYTLLAFTILISSCEKGETTNTFRIENTTEENVIIRLYSKQREMLVEEHSLIGPGLVLE